MSEVIKDIENMIELFEDMKLNVKLKCIPLKKENEKLKEENKKLKEERDDKDDKLKRLIKLILGKIEDIDYNIFENMLINKDELNLDNINDLYHWYVDVEIFKYLEKKKEEEKKQLEEKSVKEKKIEVFPLKEENIEEKGMVEVFPFEEKKKIKVFPLKEENGMLEVFPFEESD